MAEQTITTACRAMTGTITEEADIEPAQHQSANRDDKQAQPQFAVPPVNKAR